MVAVKVCLLLCATGAQLYALTPPNSTPDSKERLKHIGTELIIWVVVLMKVHTFYCQFQSILHLTECLFIKNIPCACALAEFFVALATAHESAISSSIISLLVRSQSLPDFDLTVSTPALIAGSCLTVIGCAIRTQCFRTLGRLFTFELSIRQGHKLVTSGPYSIVRHPSYSAGWFLFPGILLCHLHPQSWLVTCSGIFPSSDQAVKWTLTCIWISLCCFFYNVVGSRVRKEEEMLEEHFGDEWKCYTKKVPYKLVPWLY
ncbi:hypothetical protein K503DRAFT_411247 [Rhizopogon vinicolor AM-OR11-026]|uniref:Protein-S-isoprenylcysteine O-methyltransferase n=1 Tax=Rhizopogon vinicolor AM-OR11-026 TaxID=1314800 RepID=A0A1B7MQN7_9AGAM|nr:hypothetical protein K503DRAFT_411247 [Rhizopogon vinicolor AM-OR11-026]